MHTQASSTVEGAQAKNWKSTVPSFQHKNYVKQYKLSGKSLEDKGPSPKKKFAFLSFPPWAFCLFFVC
jgi:hypothetical protein